MGVYLPNVDMPKDDYCVTIQICPDGSIWQQYRGTVPNAKAIPVPPHGRCVDADALENIVFESLKNAIADCNSTPFGKALCMFIAESIVDEIEALPAIIPTEEGET